MHRLRGHCDTLVIDCGSSFSTALLAMAMAGDVLILITTPQPTAVAGDYATLRYLCQHGFTGGAGVLVNMVRTPRAAARVAGRLARTANRFLGRSVECLGHVVTDRHIPRAAHRRTPVVAEFSRCAASTCIEAICSSLQSSLVQCPASATLWLRLAGLFL